VGDFGQLKDGYEDEWRAAISLQPANRQPSRD